MSNVNTILFHEVLSAAGRNPGKNIVAVAVDAIATSKDLGEDISSKDLEEIVGKVFGHLERFPYDPKWVAEEAFKKYRLDFGITEV